MRIHLHSVYPSRRQPPSQAQHLAYLAGLDPEGGNSLVDSPEEADVVLLTDVVFDGAFARRLVGDSFFRTFWDKLFLHSEEGMAFRVLPGVYTSMPRSRLDRWTARAIGYPCWSGALNPLVLEFSSIRSKRTPDLLYSYMGRSSHPIRRRLLKGAHDPRTTHIQDTTGRYEHRPGGAPEKEDFQSAYVEVATRSKFAICPRGWATSSIRLYEMMALGVAPVIIGDRWTPPLGPAWEDFACFIPERSVQHIPEILAVEEDSWETRGHGARRAWDEFFATNRQFRSLCSALKSLLPHATKGRRITSACWPINFPTMSIRQWGLARRRESS
jgi:hypothetical protein